MNLIYEIYKKLKSQEIRVLKHQIKSSPFEYEKVGKLFELVTQFDEQSEDFYAQKIYGKNPDNTFRVTKSRLKRMMENVVLNDKSLSGYSVPIINIQLQLKKKLLQSEILIGRGAYKSGKSLLMQCINIAQKYELHQEYFQAEFLMYRLTSIRSPLKDFEKQMQLLQHWNQKNYAIYEALISHYYINNILLHRSPNPTQLANIRTQLNRIQEIAQQAQHPLTWNAHYLSEIYYLQIIGQFADAFDFCEKYLQLIQANPTYYPKGRLAGVYIQLAQVALQLERSEVANEYAEKAMEMFSPDEMNYLLTLELQFRIAFYDKDYERAEKIITQAFAHPSFHTAKMREAQWHYLQACLYFSQGNMKLANKALMKTDPLLSDKQGWNLYVRILDIMVMFELSLFDPLDAKILALRQFIKRANPHNQMQRFGLLLKIMREWYNTGYDFMKTERKVRPYLQELQTYHEADPFRVTGMELIRFEKWIEEKLQF
ncbi:MAG: hypothetical protein ACKVTZ_10255 [Bacteroidia bacterium]